MFEDYEKEVRNLYQMKKESHELSLNLVHPTPSNLKKECMIQFKIRCGPKDMIMLRSFFERTSEEDFYSSSIRFFDRDKFRPLSNYLRTICTTSEKNIELLAWLINFAPRPYATYCKLSHQQHLSKTENSTDKNEVLLKVTENVLAADFYEGSEKDADHDILYVPSYFTPRRKAAKRYLIPPIDGGKMEQAFSETRTFRDLLPAAKERQIDSLLKSENPHSKVTLEYPSGVRLSVDTADLELIAKLVKL